MTGGDSNLPRAFSLDISVNQGTIDTLESHDPCFWVHPGTIVISGGSVIDENTPVAPGDDPGACGELGDSCITIEMGSLYDPCDPTYKDPPASSGPLLSFRVSDKNGTIVTIAGNSARGNVVLENTEEASVNYSSCQLISECYTGPDYGEWVGLNKPTQWCNIRQCYGDADTFENKVGKGWYWVGYEDINIMLAGFGTAYNNDPAVHTWIAADFDHLLNKVGKGWYRVGYEDVTILVGNFGSGGIPTDCLD
jgi:hypothetical protein